MDEPVGHAATRRARHVRTAMDDSGEGGVAPWELTKGGRFT
jgi:hypothetical protein